jgi:ABC-type polysaccharide/polyol phosphate export permease
MVSQAFRGIADYLGSVWQYRYFWMTLVKAELQRRYRRSVLGMGWSLLQPVLMTLVLTVVYGKIFHQPALTFGPVILTGLAFWNFFSGSVLQGCQSLLSAEAYIRQQAVPTAIFPLRTALTVGFHGLISLGVSLAFALVSRMLLRHGVGNPLVLLSVAPTVALLFVLGWSLATLAGFAHAYFPDTAHLAEVALQVLMFLTPIVYTPQILADAGLGFLLRVNPLAVFLQLIRDPILDNVVPPLQLYGLAAGFVALFAGCAVWVLARLEHRLVFAL